MASVEPLPAGLEWPPTEDELPCDDGIPMETQRHVLQFYLLMDPLLLHWADRQDVFVGGNMFVYFSLEQVRHQDFRGPDFFVVLDVPRRERKSWVVWQEGKGPDVVIELLSESTTAQDKAEKKQIYQQFPLMTCELYVTMAADSSLSVSTMRFRFLKRLWRSDMTGCLVESGLSS